MNLPVSSAIFFYLLAVGQITLLCQLMPPFRLGYSEDSRAVYRAEEKMRWPKRTAKGWWAHIHLAPSWALLEYSFHAGHSVYPFNCPAPGPRPDRLLMSLSRNTLSNALLKLRYITSPAFPPSTMEIA